MIVKQHLANWLQKMPPLRWGLSLGIRLFMPRQHVGAVGAVFNDNEQVLLVEHVFRPSYPWGLPGGWVERAENPADTVRRELEEELGLNVAVKKLLFCRPQGNEPGSGIPPGLGLAFYCRLAADQIGEAHKAYEVLSTTWVEPAEIKWELASLDRQAIVLAHQEFLKEKF
jgi:ADP-ribose pyrophosphatase YjhB (NUDIX family)